MQDFTSFSSLPPEQEATFVVYERRTADALHKSLIGAIIAGVTVLVIASAIYFGVSPKNMDLGKDMDTNQLKKKSKVSAEPAPAPAPAAAPAAPAEAPAGPAEGSGSAAPAAPAGSGSAAPQ